MLIYELFFVVSIILVASLIVFVKDIFNPVFIFVASLWFGILWAMLFSKKWDLCLSGLTFTVFVLGIGTFAVVGITIKLLGERRPIESVRQFLISVKGWKIDLAIIFTFMTLIFSIMTIKQLVPAASLGDSIYMYRVKTTFWNMLVPFPSYLNYMRMLTYAIGFWFTYYFAAVLVFRQRLDVRSLLVVVFSALSSIITGSRNNFIIFLMLFMFFLYFCSQCKNGWVKDPWTEIKELDAVILTSKYEGLPMVLLEAISYGIPVISADCPTGPGDIINKDNGLPYNSGNISELKQKILSIKTRTFSPKVIKKSIRQYYLPLFLKKFWNAIDQ